MEAPSRIHRPVVRQVRRKRGAQGLAVRGQQHGAGARVELAAGSLFSIFFVPTCDIVQGDLICRLVDLAGLASARGQNKPVFQFFVHACGAAARPKVRHRVQGSTTGESTINTVCCPAPRTFFPQAGQHFIVGCGELRAAGAGQQWLDSAAGRQLQAALWVLAQPAGCAPAPAATCRGDVGALWECSRQVVLLKVYWQHDQLAARVIVGVVAAAGKGVAGAWSRRCQACRQAAHRAACCCRPPAGEARLSVYESSTSAWISPLCRRDP